MRKDHYLTSHGFRVLRIPAPETDRGLDDVMETILVRLEESSPP